MSDVVTLRASRFKLLAYAALGAAVGGTWTLPGRSEASAPDAGAARTVPGPPLDLVAPGACPTCARACSFRHPLCVDAPRGTPGPVALAVLDAADRAWDTLTGVLGAPPPDGTADGSWHLQLADGVEGGSEARPVARDPLARFDRASSFGRVDRKLPPGCPLERAVARAIARGSLWRSAPATDEGSAEAEAETLARLATPCATGGYDALEFQSHPERAIVAPRPLAYARGASAFFDWADAAFAAEPGRLVVGLWALAATRTPFGASRWAGAPTGFDVLRTSLRGALWKDSTFDDVLVRFSVARASMVPPAHAAWSIPWPAAARRLAAPRPVAPTGASYVQVDRAGAPPGSRLRLEAEWEDYGRMRWVVVKLDASGHAVGELSVTSAERATRASLTVESLESAASVLVVGVDLGSTDHPFDPNQGEWEPHGWLLTLEAE
jgi:hypothetical protein